MIMVAFPRRTIIRIQLSSLMIFTTLR